MSGYILLGIITSYVLYQIINKPKYNKQVKKQKVENIIEKDNKQEEIKHCCKCNNSIDLDDYYPYIEDQGYLCNECYYNNLGNYFDCIKCFELYDACNITCVDKCDGELLDPICNDCFNPNDVYCCENCDTYIYYNDDEQVDLCSECLYSKKSREKYIKQEEIKQEEIKETNPIEYLNRTLEKINNIIKKTRRLENLNKMEEHKNI